jgi:hypothetical protein
MAVKIEVLNTETGKRLRMPNLDFAGLLELKTSFVTLDGMPVLPEAAAADIIIARVQHPGEFSLDEGYPLVVTRVSDGFVAQIYLQSPGQAGTIDVQMVEHNQPTDMGVVQLVDHQLIFTRT